MIRSEWTTIRRRSLLERPTALALTAGECSHGVPVERGEPIVALGAAVAQEPDGRRHVDLSGVEWHPQGCGGAA